MSGYDFSLTTFSPSGKLVQIEYALNVIAAGATSLGIKCKKGVVLATEKKLTSQLVDASTVQKIAEVSDNIAVVFSGMSPDARILIKKARKIAETYFGKYKERISVQLLTKEVASVMQEYTQSGGVRPFGVSLLVAGFDEAGPHLYQVDPSGSYWAWKASSIGKNMTNVNTFLEKRYNENIDLEDAIHTAILSLKENFDGTMTSKNIEVAIVRADKQVHIFSLDEIKDYLKETEF